MWIWTFHCDGIWNELDWKHSAYEYAYIGVNHNNLIKKLNRSRSGTLKLCKVTAERVQVSINCIIIIIIITPLSYEHTGRRASTHIFIKPPAESSVCCHIAAGTQNTDATRPRATATLHQFKTTNTTQTLVRRQLIAKTGDKEWLWRSTTDIFAGFSYFSFFFMICDWESVHFKPLMQIPSMKKTYKV